MKHTAKLTLLAALLAASAGAMAADWSSDTIGYRYSPDTFEPGNATKIKKDILNYTHVDGSKTSSNLFSIDFLKSDANDPAKGSTEGATELYGFYQHSHSLSALTGHQGGYGFAKDLNLVGKFDFGTKNDSFAGAPLKLALGVSADFPVSAGFWNVGFNAVKEVNRNGITGATVSFNAAPQLTTAWSVPVGSFSFNGFGVVTGPKGKDGFGVETKTETLIRGTLMHKLGDTNLSAGVGIEYWDGKYGSANNAGATGTTGLFLVEYKL